jgi:hypothetical protein
MQAQPSKVLYRSAASCVLGVEGEPARAVGHEICFSYPEDPAQLRGCPAEIHIRRLFGPLPHVQRLWQVFGNCDNTQNLLIQLEGLEPSAWKLVRPVITKIGTISAGMSSVADAYGERGGEPRHVDPLDQAAVCEGLWLFCRRLPRQVKDKECRIAGPTPSRQPNPTGYTKREAEQVYLRERGLSQEAYDAQLKAAADANIDRDAWAGAAAELEGFKPRSVRPRLAINS